MDFCRVTTHGKDMSESFKFYQEIRGLKINRKMNPNPEMQIVLFRFREIGNRIHPSCGKQGADLWAGYFIGIRCPFSG